MTLRGIPARPNNANLGLSAVGVVAALFLIIVAFGSFTQVGVGEVGIVKHFGAIDPEHPDVFDPGIHTKVPFRDDVVIFDTRIQKEQVDASAASKDGVTIHSEVKRCERIRAVEWIAQAEREAHERAQHVRRMTAGTT